MRCVTHFYMQMHKQKTIGSLAYDANVIYIKRTTVALFFV